MVHKVKILYLSYDGLTDPLGQSQVLPYLIELSRMGYEFDIISFEKKDRFAAHKNTIEQLIAGTNIRWHPLKYTKTPPILSTLLDIRSMQNKASKLIRQHGHNIIHSRSYIPSLVARKIASRHNMPFIFDMRGFWADERVEGGIWNIDNPMYKMIYRYFKRLEIKLLQEAAAVVSLTHKGKDEISTWQSLTDISAKIFVIPCCTDIDHFNPDNTTMKGQKASDLAHKIKDNKQSPVMVYLGAIGTWYMLTEMLEFFKAVTQELPDAVLLFVTTESEFTIRKECTRIGVSQENIIVTEATRAEVPDLLSLADYGLFFIRPTFSKTASSPTKQAEFMAMGIPVICNSGVGDTDTIVKKYGSGYILRDTGKNDYQEGIKYIIESSGSDKQAIRAGAIEYFSLLKGVEAYQSVYNSILSGDKAHS